MLRGKAYLNHEQAIFVQISLPEANIRRTRDSEPTSYRQGVFVGAAKQRRSQVRTVFVGCPPYSYLSPS